MAEADYAFMPTPGVRTFGQLMGHAANAQFGACAAARGVANPDRGTTTRRRQPLAAFEDAHGGVLVQRHAERPQHLLHSRPLGHLQPFDQVGQSLTPFTRGRSALMAAAYIET